MTPDQVQNSSNKLMEWPDWSFFFQLFEGKNAIFFMLLVPLFKLFTAAASEPRCLHVMRKRGAGPSQVQLPSPEGDGRMFLHFSVHVLCGQINISKEIVPQIA
jgi:hypothetical protein